MYVSMDVQGPANNFLSLFCTTLDIIPSHFHLNRLYLIHLTVELQSGDKKEDVRANFRQMKLKVSKKRTKQKIQLL